jgi:beta-glucanase (GH16 family)
MTRSLCIWAILLLLSRGCWLHAEALDFPDTLPIPPDGKVWQLVWNDEFDGDQLDESKWGTPPDAVRRDGWWMRKAVSLDGEGHLVIRTFKEGDRYIDGCVRTRDKYEKAFGYFVARVKLQSQPGHWSAFWLWAPSVGNVGAAGTDGTEIDIYEKPWLDNRVQHTLHWDGYGAHHQSSGTVVEVPGIMEGFHSYALWWSPLEYHFYIDGQETWRTRAGGVCQVPLYIKLSDEVGKWGGDIAEADLPDQFVIDYVRVYDLMDDTAGEDLRSPDLVFPQFVNGESAGIPNRSRVILRSNSNDSISGRIRFREPGGQLIPVPIGGESADVLEYSLESWGVFDLTTDGTGDDLLTGAVEVLVDEGESSALVGTEVFEVFGRAVSVQSAETRKTHQSYVSVNGSERAAVAVYNPDPVSPALMRVILLDSEGIEQDSTQLSLDPRTQIAVYVDEEELFRDFFLANPEAFSGTINIVVEEGEGVAVVGLIQKSDNQALIAIETSEDAYQQ